MSKRKRILRDAHHEAGHAVIAWLNGLSVKLLSLKPDADTWTRVEYNHHETFRPGEVPSAPDRAAWQKWMRAHALATLAGPFAVMTFTDANYTANDILGDNMVAQQWIEEGNLDPDECTEAAAQMVGKAWSLIEAVAAELSKRMELTGEEMQQIIARVVRGGVATVENQDPW